MFLYNTRDKMKNEITEIEPKGDVKGLTHHKFHLITDV